MSTNGPLDELTVEDLDQDGNPWRMQLHAYRSLPSATISFSPLRDGAKPRACMPCSINFPITPHRFSNAGWNRAFGLVGWMDTDAAWVFFDDQFRASILSPAARPMSERQAWIDDGSTISTLALQIDASDPVLPAGDVYSYLFTFDQGIGKTFTAWGSTLRKPVGRRITGSQSDLSLIMPDVSPPIPGPPIITSLIQRSVTKEHCRRPSPPPRPWASRSG